MKNQLSLRTTAPGLTGSIDVNADRIGRLTVDLSSRRCPITHLLQEFWPLHALASLPSWRRRRRDVWDRFTQLPWYNSAAFAFHHHCSLYIIAVACAASTSGPQRHVVLWQTCHVARAGAETLLWRLVRCIPSTGMLTVQKYLFVISLGDAA